MLFRSGIGRGLALLFGTYSLLHFAWLQVFLAGFIYLAAGQELDRVLAEERRDGRRSRGDTDPFADDGIWTAPPGFRWVSRGNGLWQLAPIVVTNSPNDRVPPTWH